jgi:hypothetical protein
MDKDFTKEAYFNMLDFVYYAIPDIEQNEPVRLLLKKVLGYDDKDKKDIGFKDDCVSSESVEAEVPDHEETARSKR